MARFGRTCFFIFFCSLLWTDPVLAAELHLRVLDVGEGQALLLHKNNRAVLIDTGHAGAARDVLQRIEDLKIKALDFLILSHLHPDHASGLFRIHEAFPETGVRDNCYPQSTTVTPDMARWVAQALARIENRACLAAGDRIDWNGTIIEALWPVKQPLPGADLNQTSLVLQIAHNDRKMLVMGDAGYGAEEFLLRADRLAEVDVLLLGHHGADDASGPAFLERIRPKKAVISTNRDNFRGYPSKKVLNRLEALGVEVYKTYDDGEIHFVF